MASVKEGAIKGLKYGIPLALLATMTAVTDVNAGVPDRPVGVISKTGETVGTLWDKGKVGAVVLGGSVGLGAGTEFVQNYLQDKAYGDRVRAAQRAVLAQNNLLTQSTHSGNTKIVEYKEPHKRRDMSVAQTAANYASKGAHFVTNIPAGVKTVTDSMRDVHPTIAGAGDTIGTVASVMVKQPLMKAKNTAEAVVYKTMPGLMNTGTNPATRNFSEEPTYYIGLDPSVSENMTGSLADFMDITSRDCPYDVDRHLYSERIKDMMGSMYPLAEILKKEDPLLESMGESSDFQ